MLTLRPAQKTAVRSISHRSKLLLADVGAGKTAAALRAIIQRIPIDGVQRTLVLGTVRICNTVWGNEIET